MQIAGLSKHTTISIFRPCFVVISHGAAVALSSQARRPANCLLMTNWWSAVLSLTEIQSLIMQLHTVAYIIHRTTDLSTW